MQDMMAKLERWLPSLRQLVLVVGGSACFLILKTGLVALISHLTGLPPWLNYLIVTLSVSVLGWLYHSKVSFRVPLNRRTLHRYVHQAIVLKVVDYALFNGLVYGLEVDLRLAVIVTGGIVFSSRIFIYLHYVFTPSHAGHDATSTDSATPEPAPPDVQQSPTVPAADYSTYLGNVSRLLAGYAAAPEHRQRVASGGVVTTLLRQMLSDGDVDGVAVAKADFSEGRLGYRFDIVTDPDEVAQYATSAYFDIPIQKHWRKLADFPGKLAVCALPCHVSFLRRLQRGKLSNVSCLVALFCGHNNSPELVRLVFEREGIVEADVSEMWFDRSYLGGHLCVQLRDGTRREIPFMRFNVFRSLGFFSKPLCHHCADHLGAVADISVGDVFCSEFQAKDIKHSVIIARTERGTEIVEAAVAKGAVVTQSIASEIVFRSQKRVVVPARDARSRHFARRCAGFASRPPEQGRFRARSFLTYVCLTLNDRLSGTRLGRRILRRIPVCGLVPYILAIKLINNTLRESR